MNTILAPIQREQISQAYAVGLVKPNEMQQVVDDLIEKELNLRNESNKPQSKGLLSVFFREDLTSTGLDYEDLPETIISRAFEGEYDKFLITEQEVNTLALAELTRQRMIKVRDLGDLNRSSVVSEDYPIYADKQTVRALDYLLSHRQSVYDLINLLNK